MSNPTARAALAARHEPYQGLGALAPVLSGLGYSIDYIDTPRADIGSRDPLVPDLAVILGGPFDVGEPFLAAEIAFAAARLRAGLPTLGICLGAQILARAAGAAVVPCARREVGWKPLILTEAGRASPLQHLDGLDVLHFHGDRAEPPPGARILALTDLCANQAFSLGPAALGLQFHIEVDPAPGIEAWIAGHAITRETDGTDAPTLRRETARAAGRDRRGVAAMIGEWIAGLPTRA